MYEKTHNYAKAALDSVVLIGSATSEENDIWLTNYNIFKISKHQNSYYYLQNKQMTELVKYKE